MRRCTQGEFQRIIIRKPSLAFKVSLLFMEILDLLLQLGILWRCSQCGFRLPQENPDF